MAKKVAVSIRPLASVRPKAELSESRTMPRANITVVRQSTQPPPAMPRTDWERELVRRLESRRTALPILPDVATAALRLAGDPNANVKELVKLVEKSPPIAARFLAIANSAIYSRGTKVTNLHVAVVRLGLGGARDVMFQMSYESQTNGLKRYREHVKSSFERSVVCAHVCRAASQRLGLRSEYDYLAGLLHDIGESHVYRVLDGMPNTPTEAQVADLVRRYHTSAGAEVARAWHLPEEIAKVCEDHHADDPLTPLLRLVQIADLVVGSLGSPGSVDAVRLELLGVDEATTASLFDVAKLAQSAI